jgi:hypothetical protein
MIIEIKGKKCQYEDCDQDAEVVARGRKGWYGEKGHPEPNFYCLTHGRMVSDEGSPEYVASCPNCDCIFGVN